MDRFPVEPTETDFRRSRPNPPLATKARILLDSFFVYTGEPETLRSSGEGETERENGPVDRFPVEPTETGFPFQLQKIGIPLVQCHLVRVSKNTPVHFVKSVWVLFEKATRKSEFDGGTIMNKKKKITILVCTLFMVFSLGACGKTKEDAAVVTQQESSLQIESMDEETTSEESTTFNNGEEDDIELKDTIEIDFTYDYTEDIKADVAYVVSNSSSLQEELKNIDTITQKYTLLAESALTQGEMNVASQWLYVIWDTELNNLWSRFSSLANQDTKEMVLEEQRNWIAMKEEVTLMSLGSQEENGSMYPMLVNSLWEEKTKNRAYFIANELAQIEGESFAMPEASTKYGLFVDNQGTDAVYSSLITRQSWEGEDEAIISVYRLGEIEGSFIDNGNGNLDFTSDDGSIKGTIQINGWNGATFEVTETIGAVPFSVGEKFEFPFAF